MKELNFLYKVNASAPHKRIRLKESHKKNQNLIKKILREHIISLRMVCVFSENIIPVRSSHQRCSVRNDVLRNFTKFRGKHLCQSLFFNKVSGLRPATLLKKRLWHRRFPVNFAKFLRTPPFLQNTSGRLFLSCGI